MLKVYTEFSPEIMQEIFPIKEQGQCNLKNQTDFVIPYFKSLDCGIESLKSFRVKNIGMSSTWC